ncbi:MAG: hypothetical protein NZ954_05295 [Thermofilaceae archaeon]|nr:hypothetical protein [Thermofilaceae archaeon]MCX8181019.1 hypothetical protein [Thermofilaceae archaeon]MDW8004123.1 hypothetical protein [Thermofilaceae archaeon]
MSRVPCGKCRFYVAYPFHETLGYCSTRSEFTTCSSTPCSEFKPLSLEDVEDALAKHGFVYCLTCRSSLTNLEEAFEHLSSGHIVNLQVLQGEGIHEEVYAGD